MMKEITQIEAKQLMIELLDVFSRFCELNQLRYYLTYGTLLGAVRHQGFIPWDDDVDVMMPRPDYEKFIQLTKNGISPLIKINSFKQTGGYIYPFAKVIHSETLLIESDYDFKIGVFLDVFPIDGLPESIEKRNHHYHKMNRYRKFLSLAYRRKHSWANPIKNIMMHLLKIMVRGYGGQRILKHIDNLAKSYDFNQSSIVGICVWGYGGREACVKNEMVGHFELPFENLILKVPANTDRWLTQVYGDYMTPPPENQRISPHKNKIYWIK